MANINVSDYVLLAEASYADFSQGLHKEEIDKALEDSTKKTQNLVKYITDNYEVVAHWKDQPSGFSGTLFRKMKEKVKKEGMEYVLALRGTNGGKDIFVTDIGDIVNDGLAHHQIVDMYNFWQQITAPKGEPYDVMYVDLVADDTIADLKNWVELKERVEAAKRDGAVGFFIDSGAIKAIKKTYSDKLYKIGDERRLGLGIPVSKVTTTGHSLGGHLSAAFSRLFPDKTEHSYMVNGAGFGTKSNPIKYVFSLGQDNILNVFKALGGTDHFDKTKITNLIGDKNIDVTAMDKFWGLSQPGKTSELFIEEGITGPMLGHGKEPMSDTMQAASLFFAMDGKLNQTDLSEALKTLNPVFEAVTNDDEETLEKVVYQIGKLLGDKVREQAATRNELYERIASLKALLTGKKDVGEPEDAQGGKYQFVSLATDAGSWKDDVSQNSDKGTALRYALRELNPFAVVGADYTAHNRHGNLNLYSIENPYDMTDTYLQRCWIGRLRQ